MKADTAFIVRAVNSYEALREALREFVEEVEAHRASTADAFWPKGKFRSTGEAARYHSARAALALADGEGEG